MSDEQKIYHTGEVCEMLGVDRKLLYRYMRIGVIPERRNPVNNYRIYTQEDVDKVAACLRGECDYEPK